MKGDQTPTELYPQSHARIKTLYINALNGKKSDLLGNSVINPGMGLINSAMDQLSMGGTIFSGLNIFGKGRVHILIRLKPHNFSSLSTIIRANCLNWVWGFLPNLSRALLKLPTRESTSERRRYLGSISTGTRPVALSMPFSLAAVPRHTISKLQ